MSTPSFKYGNGVWATKEGSSLAYNDDNGHYKPLPFSVSRASSATRVNKQGLIEVVGNDRLRIDYSESANGVALLEPSRTNLSPQSEELDGVYWNAGTSSVTADSEISPDGLQNADTLTVSSPTGGLYSDDISVSASTTYTFSFYAKRGTIASDETALAVRDQSNATFISTDVTYSATTDSWTRVEHTFTTPVGCTSVRVYPQRLSGLGLGTIHLWGVQLEAGSYATSYIPTSGSTATRQADVANGAGVANVFSSSEGVFYADAAKINVAEAEGGIFLTKDTNNEIRLNFATSNRLNVFVNVGGSNQVYHDNTSFTLSEYNRIAIKYKVNDYAIYVNGFEIHTDTSALVPSDMDSLDFNRGGTGYFYGKAKAINVYQTALTDAELEYLTSYRSLAEMATELNLNAL